MVLHMTEAERKAYEQFQISRASAMDVLAGQYQEGKEQGIEIGKEQGIEIGKEQGIEVAKRDNARKMLAHGEPLDKIQLYTGLSEAEIRAL